ncbi:MAG: dCTP deaminase [Myxococcota bacterium]
MILSDTDIKARLEKGDLIVDPIGDPELQIQPASIDLRLGSEFVLHRQPLVPFLDARDPASIEEHVERIDIAEGEGFVLQPGAFALGTTLERVRIPDDLVGRVEGRSSIGRLAVIVHATAGFIDPGFEGQITLELSNLGQCAVKLYPGMRISQVVFHEMKSPAERPYGAARGSKYQGQSGPVASRIGNDRALSEA